MTNKVIAVSGVLNVMINAQNKYILSKIKDKSFRKGYVAAMTELIKVSSYEDDFEDYIMYIDTLQFAREHTKVKFYDKYFRSAEREGENLAITTVKDIVDSINTRFIEGGSKLYEGLLDVKKRQKSSI